MPLIDHLRKVLHGLAICLALVGGSERATGAAYDWAPDWFKDLRNGDTIELDWPVSSEWVRATCDFTSSTVAPENDVAKALGIAGQTHVRIQVSVTRDHKIMKWTNGYGIYATFSKPETKEKVEMCLYFRPDIWHSGTPFRAHPINDMRGARHDFTGFPDWFADLSDGQQLVLTPPIDKSWVREKCEFDANPADITQTYKIADNPYAQARLTREEAFAEWNGDAGATATHRSKGISLPITWREPDTQTPVHLCLFLTPTHFPIMLASDVGQAPEPNPH